MQYDWFQLHNFNYFLNDSRQIVKCNWHQHRLLTLDTHFKLSIGSEIRFDWLDFLMAELSVNWCDSLEFNSILLVAHFSVLEEKLHSFELFVFLERNFSFLFSQQATKSFSRLFCFDDKTSKVVVRSALSSDPLNKPRKRNIKWNNKLGN